MTRSITVGIGRARCNWATSANEGAAEQRPAARRRADPGRRADAGPPLRHPAPGPPGRRGRQGRAPGARRVGAGGQSRHDRPRGPGRRRHVPAQQPVQAQRRPRPQERGRPRALPRPGRSLRRGRRELQGRHDGPPRPRLRRRPPSATRPSSTCPCPASATTTHRPTRPGPPTPRSSKPCPGSTTGPDAPARPPRPNPVGALGDISSGLFAVIGILAALRHRDATGQGQHVDVAMLDALLSMTDVVTNLWSLGLRPDKPMPLILDAFQAGDGFVVTQIVREHQFEALARLIGRRGRGSTTRGSPIVRAGGTTSRARSARPSRPGCRRGPDWRRSPN